MGTGWSGSWLRSLGLGASALLCCQCGSLKKTETKESVAFPEQGEAGNTMTASIDAGSSGLALPSPSEADMIPGVPPSEAAGGGGGSASLMTPLMDFSAMALTPNGYGLMHGWQRSASEAIQSARLQGKMLIFAMTNSGVSLSQQMNASLLTTPEFLNATSEDFVRVWVDYGNSDTEKSDYYARLKKRMKLHGFPSLLITLPDGREVIRFNGYNPEWKARYMASIEEAKDRGGKMIATHRRELERAGYQSWKDKTGRPIFAKLEQVDANQLTFTSEWGEVFRTFLNRLDEEDQEAIRRKKL